MSKILSSLAKFVPSQKNKQNHLYKKKKVLEFIETKAAKTDFIHWVLNNNGSIALSEKDDWDTIKSKITKDKEISYNQLRSYSSTLEDGAILEETLKKVEKTTQEAEETARKLSDLGGLKKFSIMIGGVLIFLGAAKLLLAIGLTFGSWQVPFDFKGIDHALSALNVYLMTTGGVEVLGGVLLVTL